MRKKWFIEEQIIAILREGEASGQIKELTRPHGITETTFYRSLAKYGGISVSETRRLKALEDENRRLKKLVVDQALENARLKDVVGRKW